MKTFADGLVVHICKNNTSICGDFKNKHIIDRPAKETIKFVTGNNEFYFCEDCKYQVIRSI